MSTSNKTNNSDLNTTSSWSVVDAEVDGASLTANSIITGFDVISLNDFAQVPCPRCTFLNSSNITSCEMCHGCLDSVPTSQQSLTQKILSVVEKCVSMDATGNVYQSMIPFEVPLEEHLQSMVSRFMEAKQNQQVQLCYCFTQNDPELTQAVLQGGFGPLVTFGTNPDAAAMAWYSRGQNQREARSVQERKRKQDFFKPHHGPQNTVGWLAAIVGLPGDGHSTFSRNDRLVRVQSGTAWTCQRRDVAESLPLVCFPADMMRTDLVRRLMNGMTEAFHDSPSFWSNSTEVNDTANITDSRKRARSGVHYRRQEAAGGSASECAE